MTILFCVLALIIGFTIAPDAATVRARRNRPVIRPGHPGLPPRGPGSSVPPKRWSE